MRGAEWITPVVTLSVWTLLCVFNIGPFEVVSYDPTDITCLVNRRAWALASLPPFFVGMISLIFGIAFSVDLSKD